MSNPAVQNVTAAVSQRMRGSSEPRIGDPGGRRRDPQGESQHQVRKRREALGERIEEHDCRAPPAPAGNTAGSTRARRNRNTSDETTTKPQPKPRATATRQEDGAILRARIARVDIGIDKPVERHGRRARRRPSRPRSTPACAIAVAPLESAPRDRPATRRSARKAARKPSART